MSEQTNFEKWKHELTIEDVLVIFKSNGCVDCPAEELCKTVKGCENAFEKWAQGKVNNDG
ncbi:hypothetical protein [Treponema sp. R6D11]